MAYVERNPVRAGLANGACAYRWSSAAARADQVEPAGDALLSAVDQEEWAKRIREATLRGRPLGSPEFIEDLTRRVGRPLLPQAVGRPRKASVEQIQLALEIGN